MHIKYDRLRPPRLCRRGRIILVPSNCDIACGASDVENGTGRLDGYWRSELDADHACALTTLARLHDDPSMQNIT
jgi:hypothetical protein